MGSRERYLVGLDIGTSKVAAIVGEMMDDGSLEIIGIGVVRIERHSARRRRQSRGGGRLHQARRRGGRADGRRRSRLGLHRHLRARTSRGSTAAASSPSPARTARSRATTCGARSMRPRRWRCRPGREILHVLPQDFVVDDQDGIGAPVGMTGARLEVNVHIVTGGTTATQNVVACVNRAGISVVDTVIEQLAASEAVLTPDEKELGVALVDIGGGTTDLAIFERGSLWHTGVIGIGGDHFTNDIAVGLRTPIPGRREAEAEMRMRAVVARRRRRDDGSRERRRQEAAADGAPRAVGNPSAARRGDFSSGVGRDSTRGLREVAQLRHRADGRGRDSRRDARDRRADIRSADQARVAGRCGRPRRSRRQSRSSRRRSGWCCTRSGITWAKPAGWSAPARSDAWPGGCAGCSRNSSKYWRPRMAEHARKPVAFEAGR